MKYDIKGILRSPQAFCIFKNIFAKDFFFNFKTFLKKMSEVIPKKMNTFEMNQDKFLPGL